MYKSRSVQAKKRIKKVLCGWLWRNAKRIEGQTIRNAPKGASGNLRKGTKAYLDENRVKAAVSVHAIYGRFVEGVDEGGNKVTTRRHFLAWETSYMFARWGRQRGYDTTRGGLLVWGYRNPFFQKAIDQVKPMAQSELRSLRI